MSSSSSSHFQLPAIGGGRDAAQRQRSLGAAVDGTSAGPSTRKMDDDAGDAVDDDAGEVRPSMELIRTLVRRVHDPSIVRVFELQRSRRRCRSSSLGDSDGGEKEPGPGRVDVNSDELAALTKIPWVFHPLVRGDGAGDGSGGKGASSAPNHDDASRNNRPRPTTSCSPSHRHRRPSDNDNGHYPPWSHLDLRLHQNSSWATSRLEQGASLAKMGKTESAAKCYRDGLELCPDHAPLLVAYGALQANAGRLDEAKRCLVKALDVEPDCPNAREYLDKVEGKMKATVAKAEAAAKQAAAASVEMKSRTGGSGGNLVPGGSLRGEQALRDAIAERAFLSGGGGGDSGSTKYPLLGEPSSVPSAVVDSMAPVVGGEREEKAKHDEREDDRRRREGRRRKKKKRKDAHKRGRKRRFHSDSDDDSEEDERRRRRHKKRRRKRSSKSKSRKRRHHRRDYDYSSSSSLSSLGSSGSSNASNGLPRGGDLVEEVSSSRKGQKHHRKHRRRASKRSSRTRSSSPPADASSSTSSHDQRNET